MVVVQMCSYNPQDIAAAYESGIWCDSPNRGEFKDVHIMSGESYTALYLSLVACINLRYQQERI